MQFIAVNLMALGFNLYAFLMTLMVNADIFYGLVMLENLKAHKD